MEEGDVGEEANQVVQNVRDQSRQHANHGRQHRHQDHTESGFRTEASSIRAHGSCCGFTVYGIQRC